MTTTATLAWIEPGTLNAIIAGLFGAVISAITAFLVYRSKAIDQEARRVDRLHAKHKQCEDAARKTAESLQALLTSIKSDSRDEILQHRNEALTAICCETIPSLIEVAEWNAMMLKKKPDQMATYIVNSVVPEIIRVGSWIRALNSTHFVDDMKTTPLKIAKQSTRRFAALADHLPPKHRTGCIQPLEDAIESLMAA